MNPIVILPIWLNHRGKTPPWFGEQASSHKLFLDPLHGADALARKFRHITDAIALLQKAYHFPIFFLLLFKALERAWFSGSGAEVRG